MRIIATGLLCLTLLVPSWTNAHHSRVTFFDMSRTVELAGEITRVQWRHPHVRYWIQADPEFGGALWELETTPKQRTHVQAALDMGKNILEANDLATGNCRRVKNRNGRNLDVIFL